MVYEKPMVLKHWKVEEGSSSDTSAPSMLQQHTKSANASITDLVIVNNILFILGWLI